MAFDLAAGARASLRLGSGVLGATPPAGARPDDALGAIVALAALPDNALALADETTRQVLRATSTRVEALPGLPEALEWPGLDEYDRDEDRLTFDSMFGALFGAPVAPPSTLDGLLSLVAATDRVVVREAMRGLDPAKWTVRVTCVRPSGVQFPAELAMEFRAREIGRGLLGIGTLQDLSQELVVDDLRRRADTDVLTGLANRRRLEVVLREEPSRHLQRLGAGRGGPDHLHVLLEAEKLGEVVSRLRDVVHDQDAVLPHEPSSSPSGKATSTRVPRPGSELIRTDPPNSAASA
jgi:hypothetical protein